MLVFASEMDPATHPVATSHIFMVLSLEAEIMWSPLGIIATDETLWSCPAKQGERGLSINKKKEQQRASQTK